MLHCKAMTSFPYTAISPSRLYTPQGSCFPPWSQFKPCGSEHANSCRSNLTFQFLDSCEEEILAKVIKTDSTSQLEPESRMEGVPFLVRLFFIPEHSSHGISVAWASFFSCPCTAKQDWESLAYSVATD